MGGIVFVPGLMGSTLAYDGKPLWSSSLVANLWTLAKEPERLQVVPGADVEPGEVIGRFHMEPRLPWSLRRGHQLLVDALEARAQSRGWDFNAFAYDWRLSARDAAARLAQEMAAWTPPVVLVGHSMGGLVARLSLLHPGMPRRVHKVVQVGSPVGGSAAAFRALFDDYGVAVVDPLARALTFPHGAAALRNLREVLQSLPSMRELVPPLQEPFLVQQGRSRVHPYEPQAPVFTADEKREAIATHDAIQQAGAILQSPDGPQLFVARSNGFATQSRFTVRVRPDPREGYDVLDHGHEDGDGRVTLASASYRSPKARNLGVIAGLKHDRMCQSPRLTDLVLGVV